MALPAREGERKSPPSLRRAGFSPTADRVSDRAINPIIMRPPGGGRKPGSVSV